MNPIRVVLVDDHRLVRQGVRSVLDPDPEFAVIGEAASGSETLAVVQAQQPDMVLLDLQLPDMSGVEICHRIAQISPRTIVLILTAFIDQSLVDACLRAGAQGYLLKDAEDLHLKQQLRIAMQGHAVLDPRAADVLTDFVRSQEPAPEVLTLREITVLRFIADGLTNREIGDKLHLSENTIKGHLKDILAKTGARNRVHAVLLARERGIL